MNVPPVSVERVQKCVVNFEIYRFLKKAANLPHPPLCTWEPISYSLCSSHGWGISARAHVQTALLYLRNGLAD